MKQYIADAFTDELFKGNPAAVCVMDEWISDELMRNMLALLKKCGYKRASLVVQKANYAVRMYKKVGFEVVDENDREYVMAVDPKGDKSALYYS